MTPEIGALSGVEPTIRLTAWRAGFLLAAICLLAFRIPPVGPGAVRAGPTISADATEPGTGLKLPDGPVDARERTARPGPDAEPDHRTASLAVRHPTPLVHLTGARRDLLAHRRTPQPHLLPDTTAPPQRV